LADTAVGPFGDKITLFCDTGGWEDAVSLIFFFGGEVIYYIVRHFFFYDFPETCVSENLGLSFSLENLELICLPILPLAHYFLGLLLESSLVIGRTSTFHILKSVHSKPFQHTVSPLYLWVLYSWAEPNVDLKIFKRIASVLNMNRFFSCGYSLNNTV
jgi:hypothetical protein